MAAALTIAALQDEPLDALVWRTLGKGAGAVERVLDANPGLADLGPFLPQGLSVLIPAEADSQAQAQLVQLWD